MHASSSSFPISISSFIQYTFLAVLAYILAGAPLLSILGLNSESSGGVKARDGSVDVGKLENLVIPEKNLSCKEHAYKGVYVLSREPLVVYIEGFLSEGEGEEVVKLRYVFHTRSLFRRYGGIGN
jgi:prolyl 4-hydroxylase